MEEKYYFCQKCKKAVSNKLLKCDSPDCRKTFRNAPVYTMAQIEEMIKNSEGDEKDINNEDVGNGNSEELMMKCPVCGKRYSVIESVCQCGMPLIMDVSCEDVINEFGQPDIRLGEVLDDICWKLKVRRYRNQRIYQEAEINIDRTVFSLGRIYILENNIFSDDREEVQDSIINVSGRNAIILVEGDKLYLRMDDKYDNKPVEGKSPVYLNGEKIDIGVNVRIHPGNKILMGHYSKETRNLCVEYELLEAERKLYNTNEELMMKMMDELSDVKKNLADIDKKTQDIDRNTMEIKQSTDKISDDIVALSKLQIDNFKDVKSYMDAWHKETDNINDKTDEEFLKLYLEDYKNYDEIINCLSVDQRKDLLRAAKMEYTIEKAKLEQYGGAFLDLCLMIEDFLSKTVSKILEKIVGNEMIREKMVRW